MDPVEAVARRLAWQSHVAWDTALEGLKALYLRRAKELVCAYEGQKAINQAIEDA